MVEIPVETKLTGSVAFHLLPCETLVPAHHPVRYSTLISQPARMGTLRRPWFGALECTGFWFL